jgi:hypothetical protein
LTGQDYPIKSNHFIDAFLKEHNGKVFMEFFALPHHGWQNYGMDRIEGWHLRMFNRHLRLFPHFGFAIKRAFPRGFKPFGGSSYWCLPRECVEHIYEHIQKSQAFVDFFKHVDVPDEIFFQTIILNSSFEPMTVNDNLRYIDWKALDAGSPAILVKDDFQKLASSPKLFARKFDATVDAEVLDLIDREILA